MQFKDDEAIRTFLRNDGFLPDGRELDTFVKIISHVRRVSIRVQGLRDKNREEIKNKLKILMKSGCG
jgi:hypothetical protein